jgi:hypothetical protein
MYIGIAGGKVEGNRDVRAESAEGPPGGPSRALRIVDTVLPRTLFDADAIGVILLREGMESPGNRLSG